MTNKHLQAAKQAKNDEFYTQISDIETELRHYTKHFKDKVVYCNCDDPTWSNFWRYFYRNFGDLGLKKLISTHYEQDGSASYAAVYEGGHDNAENCDEGVTKVPLKGDGDFRSDECIEYLKQSDIVVTNPMFSLFREYVATLEKYNKKFIIWGNQNAITYKEFFPLLMNRKVWLGTIANKTCVFRIPNSYKKWDEKETESRNDGFHYAKVPAISVFTNLSVQKSTDQMVIWKPFDQKEYPAYDNYAAFEVSKVVDIPKNTEITASIDKDNLQGWQDTYHDDLTVVSSDDKTVTIKITRPIFGVPITMLNKYNPESIVTQHNLGEEFDILGLSKGETWNDINDIQTIKHYKNAKQVNVKGQISGCGKINTSVGLIESNPSKTYYLADNAKGKIATRYARIFIRAKKGVQF